jgi:hypothetical protein
MSQHGTMITLIVENGVVKEFELTQEEIENLDVFLKKAYDCNRVSFSRIKDIVKGECGDKVDLSSMFIEC